MSINKKNKENDTERRRTGCPLVQRIEIREKTSSMASSKPHRYYPLLTR
jgi:hypothetical protein